MPIVPFAPPQPVATSARHGFDYVTVDAQRRRVYAAHGGDDSLLIVDADSGKVLGQVRVGPMAGSAVDPATGHVYTGDGDADAVSEVDPVAMKELRRVSVPGHVDAIAYDPSYHRIYADEDDGTRLFVIDTRSFTLVKTIALPGHKPEFLAIDPTTHDVYQNIATNSEVAVIDPRTLSVSRTISTPDLTNNHPLQLDGRDDTLLVAGENGVLAVYTLAGKEIASTSIPQRVDQCAFDSERQVLACAANSNIVLYAMSPNGAPKLIGELAVGERMHNVGIDEETGRIWAVWGSPTGDFVQGFTWKP
jgi:hypothetical protein